MQHVHTGNYHEIAEKCREIFNFKSFFKSQKSEIIDQDVKHCAHFDYSVPNNDEKYQKYDDVYDLEFDDEKYKIDCPPNLVHLKRGHDGYPIIGYLSDGHINIHPDPFEIRVNGITSRTLIICVDANDDEGGTLFYFGSDTPLEQDKTMKTYSGQLIKSSVEKNQGAIFIGSMLHSGKPVAKGKFKVIVQIPFYFGLDYKTETIEIQLENKESVIVRKNYMWVLKHYDWTKVSKRDFYPIYRALYGLPTIGTDLVKSVLQPEHWYSSGFETSLNDLVLEASTCKLEFSCEFDEAIHLKRMRANIYNYKMNLIKTVSSYDEYYKFMQDNLAVFKAPEDMVMEMTKKLNKTKDENRKDPFIHIGILCANLARQWNNHYKDDGKRSIIVAHVAWY